MLNETISQIEARLRDSGGLPEERRRELLTLLNNLKHEVAGLEGSHADEARTIAGFASLSAHEATRETPNEGALRHAVSGLATSVEGFEASHPRLVQAANAVASALSNLGI